MHPSARRSEILKNLLKKRAKGETYPQLINYLRVKGFSDPTIRSYVNAIKAISKNTEKVKRILNIS